MKKIFMLLLSSFFLLTSAASSHAVMINDVVTFNKFMVKNDFVRWEHDLNKYGYSPADYGTSFTLILEVRDYDDASWKDEGPPDRPHFALAQGHGRSYSWVHSSGFSYQEQGPLYIEADGVVRPVFALLSGRVWLTSSTLIMDIKSPTNVPEPAPLALMLFALFGLALRRRRQ